MAQTILAILMIIIGLGCAAMAIMALLANSIGGASNPSAVNHTPMLVCAAIAILAIGCGGWLLFN